MTSARYVIAVRWAGVGKLRRLYLTSKGGYTLTRAASSTGTFTAAQVVAARAWAARGKHRLVVTKLNPYPFLVLDSDTRPTVPTLMRKLNQLGRQLRRVLLIREGTRTHAQQQAFWDAFVARGKRPPLVARPGTSNHEARPGEALGHAADVGTKVGNANVGDVATARDRMRRLGLCLPVPGESWHVEEGSTWRG